MGVFIQIYQIFFKVNVFLYFDAKFQDSNRFKDRKKNISGRPYAKEGFKKPIENRGNRSLYYLTIQILNFQFKSAPQFP